MILEEIGSNVVCSITKNGAKIICAAFDTISDEEYATLTVVGNGKVILRVDPNCTMEVNGVPLSEEVKAVSFTPPPPPPPEPTPAPPAPPAPSPEAPVAE